MYALAFVTSAGDLPALPREVLRLNWVPYGYFRLPPKTGSEPVVALPAIEA